MATARELRHQTLADFLAWERDQPERHERLRGAIRMMTGGTVAHNHITRNCARALESRLQRAECEVFTSDMKVVSPEEDVMYPDVLVCGEISARATELESPIIVVEVLSESTAARDHSLKRWAYQMIPSLEHYLLIDQAKPVVEVASRDHDGSWRSVFYRGLEGQARLNALDIEIDLADVFARSALLPWRQPESRHRPEASTARHDVGSPGEPVWAPPLRLTWARRLATCPPAFGELGRRHARARSGRDLCVAVV